jgi:hypothetical protein
MVYLDPEIADPEGLYLIKRFRLAGCCCKVLCLIDYLIKCVQRVCAITQGAEDILTATRAAELLVEADTPFTRFINCSDGKI